MEHKLRDYQKSAIQSLRAKLAEGKKRIVLQIPTGGGKTAVAGSIIRSALGKDRRAIFTVPALSLITQTIDSFTRDGIKKIGVMQGQHELTDKDQPVQICSVQTLARRFVPKADLVMIDECHVVYDLYNRWFNDPEWADIPIIGLSATPWTKGLGKLYQDLVIGETTQGLIDAGYLVPFRPFAPSHVDLSDVRTVAGDFDLEGLDKAMNTAKLTADIVETWLDRGEGRPTLCFAVNRAHAQNLCDAFNRAGVPAAYVDGETPLDERDELAVDFKAGKYKIICNVGVMTTGVDLPFVSCLIIARPTKSEMLWCQIVGRGLRLADGKKDCIILDHSDTTKRLGFVTDIIHHELNMGKKRDGGAAKEWDEPKPKECPKCTYLRPPKMKVCPNCGFEAKPQANVFTAEGTLAELNGTGKNKKQDDGLTQYDRMEIFYQELLGFALMKGYKSGWAYHQYISKYKKPPDKQFDKTPLSPSSTTINWLKHQWIKRRAAETKARGTFANAEFTK